MTQSAAKYLTSEAQKTIRTAISEAGGQEVFFLGRRQDHSGPYTEIRVIARGHDKAVPAISKSARFGDCLIHNHPSGNLTPSNADLTIASRLGDEGLAILIVNNEATRAYCVVEPPAPADQTLPLPKELVQKALGPKGALAASLKGFEERESQLIMAGEVCDSLNTDGIRSIEAGTGTGKSIAYLTPAILWLMLNENERILISTETINLQEQLIERDIPMTMEALGADFPVSMMKGRANYICLRRLATTRALNQQQELIPGEHTTTIEAIHRWAESGGQTRQELNIPIPTQIWSEICSDGDYCSRFDCPFNDQCPFFNHRRQAASARLLVANHHLLMADLALRRNTNNYQGAAVMPRFHRLVIDEAHNLEESASSFLGLNVSRLGIRIILSRLAKTGTQGRNKTHTPPNINRGDSALPGPTEPTTPKRTRHTPGGLLTSAARFCPNNPMLARLLSHDLVEQVEECNHLLKATFDSVESWAADVGGTTLSDTGATPTRSKKENWGRGEINIRLTPERTSQLPFTELVINPLHTLYESLLNIQEGLTDGVERLRDIINERGGSHGGGAPYEGSSSGSTGSSVQDTLTGITIELAGLARRIGSGAKAISTFTDYDQDGDDHNLVRWIQVKPDRRGTYRTRLYCVPIEVGPELANHLFNKINSVVLTSATLTTGQSGSGRRTSSHSHIGSDTRQWITIPPPGTESGPITEPPTAATPYRARETKVGELTREFHYFRKRLGLDLIDTQRLKEMVLPSPFNFAKQALVLIPADLPDPRTRNFNETISKVILRSVEIADGGTFVLFTSHSAMNRVYAMIERDLISLGITPVKQGQRSRTMLLDQFRNTNRAVLFGSDSFWEGVDVPGDALRQIIITKLPFRVPGHPLAEARAEAIEAGGGNYFMEMTVPEAVIRLKQGFGRLIRNQRDRGSVTILDSRIVGKSYGRRFINALPEGVPIHTTAMDEIMELLTRFHHRA